MKLILNRPTLVSANLCAGTDPMKIKSFGIQIDKEVVFSSNGKCTFFEITNSKFSEKLSFTVIGAIPARFDYASIDTKEGVIIYFEKSAANGSEIRRGAGLAVIRRFTADNWHDLVSQPTASSDIGFILDAKILAIAMKAAKAFGLKHVTQFPVYLHGRTLVKFPLKDSAAIWLNGKRWNE